MYLSIVLAVHQYPELLAGLTDLDLVVIEQRHDLLDPRLYTLKIEFGFPIREQLPNAAAVKVVSALTATGPANRLWSRKPEPTRTTLTGRPVIGSRTCFLRGNRVKVWVQAFQLLNDLIRVVALLQQISAHLRNISVCGYTRQSKNLADLSQLQVTELKCCHRRDRESAARGPLDHVNTTVSFLHQVRI